MEFILLAVVSAAVTGAAAPIVARLAVRIDAVDRPNDRKVSDRSGMPLLGGFAVALGTMLGISLALQLGIGSTTGGLSYVDGYLLGSSLLIVVGALDDRFDIKATTKLLVQIAAASAAFYYGVRIAEFREPISGIEYTIPIVISWLVTMAWIVGVTNAMNLIDGIDGEATGVGAIIAITLTMICWQAEQYPGVVLGLALFGALVGFLPFNFPPARIFLGDTGALFIGFTLSVLAIESYQGGHRKAALLTFAIPLLALAVPILDTALAILRRVRSGRPIFSADRRHMHHRLLASRGAHRPAVLSLYFLTACFCMIAVSFAQLRGYTAFIFFGAVVLLTFRLLRNMGVFLPESVLPESELPGAMPGADPVVPSEDSIPGPGGEKDE